MRPLLIGQAPGPNTDPECPLFPVPARATGGRLQELTGLTRGDYLRTFDRMNLLPYFPGSDAQGDRFPVPDAKFAARAIRPLLNGRTVVLVGRNVATAFGFKFEFHEWCEHWYARRRCSVQKDNGTCRMAVTPHPSGRSRWYNDPDNVEQAERFWRDLLQD